ncbi:branched-chain amino acid ABC transporter permease [Phytomonospora endophytica]|uniref:Branched-chain amino acid transport system permease protein n=1 Tax=Phytomonospora endophytica TaxID=714109 RepID=A0A841FKZ4_9ACTN|nr:branched-chain amino acid ABC transporter permease [Phytomonospora endophytica]MBB6035593.1 branched-chain amino acid transport system permease protein [Phytomonospora endophytica]GIG70045.1 branched-chain amino acid ABC transporter permease [Phytomonospora endophytica]
MNAPTARILRRAAVIALLAIAATFALDPFRNYQLAVAAACFAAVAGLSVLVGLTGQLSLGHAVLMAAGGYGYAITASAVAEALPGAPALAFLTGLLGAAVVAGALGLLLGLAAARLTGPYLAGLTLALVIALPSAANVIPALSGDQGRAAPFFAVPDGLASLIVVEQWHAWLAIAVAAVAVTPLVILRRGRGGLRMRAALGDETGARLAGVDPGRVKAGAFAMSALSAGLGGAVLALATQSVSPGAYGLGFSLLLVVAAVVGGLGSIGGAALGSALVVVLPWLVDTFAGTLPADLGRRLNGNLAVLLFGAVVIAVTAAAPGGLARLLGRLPRPASPRAATPTTEPHEPAQNPER